MVQPPSRIAPAPRSASVSQPTRPQPVGAMSSAPGIITTEKPVSIKLGVSKHWVLPPRPKPGRKPNSEKSGKFREKPRAAPSSISSSDSSPLALLSPSLSQHTHPKIAQPAHADGGTDCGVCEDGEQSCVCRDLKAVKDGNVGQHGLQIVASPPSTNIGSGEALRKYEGFKPLAAVPLKRNPLTLDTEKPGEIKLPKFRRVGDIMPISAIAQPSDFGVNLTPGDSCGFCKDNTPCLCAGEGLGDNNINNNNNSVDNDILSHGISNIKRNNNKNFDAKSHSPPSSFRDPPSQSISGTFAYSPTSASTEISTVLSPEAESSNFGCANCQKEPMSMLFCLSLSAAKPLPVHTVAIPCTVAFKTIEKHQNFVRCDLGELVRMLEVNGKMIGVQSINKALQYLNSI